MRTCSPAVRSTTARSAPAAAATPPVATPVQAVPVAVAVALGALVASPVHAAADDGRARDAHALTSDEIRAQVRPADAEIARCYLGAIGDRAGAGHLDVTLRVHRKGIVDAIDVRAPGVSPKLAQQIEGCVRAALDGITFPARRAGTTATVPYFWQKTAAPDAGPQESCWSANGCRTDGSARGEPRGRAGKAPASEAAQGRRRSRAADPRRG